jgi:(E)-4-hydroxy-3-methylbut-2-enyl-diphosphate synthase
MESASAPAGSTGGVPVGYRRRPARVVRVGDVAIGGNNPIRVQSMTTPATTDVAATLAQIERLARAGCEIVRVTVPSTADAQALAGIRRGMEARGLRMPLVADIHFSPQAAMLAVPYVEKVRINPGNFADKKRFAVREYSDAEYAAELTRIEERFTPLVRACRERGVALRIGTNHGSLSDRILNRYGDTPLGMVESALEFVRICRRNEFHALVLSMKSSNPRVAIQAYRLLASRMDLEGMDYPFHLGVTEAGDGEDGRVKSAIGIGALLDEGIGDTVRVSLTEDPVAEIPVARELVRPYNERLGRAGATPAAAGQADEGRDPFTYLRRTSSLFPTGSVLMGEEEPVRVESLLASPPTDEETARRLAVALGGSGVPPETRTEVVEVILPSPERIDALAVLGRALAALPSPPALAVRPTASFLQAESSADLTRVLAFAQRISFRVQSPLTGEAALKRGVGLDLARAAGKPICWIVAPARPGESAASAADLAVDLVERTRRAGLSRVALAVETGFGDSPAGALRHVAARLDRAGLRVPLILSAPYDPSAEQGALAPAVAIGALLCDGVGDAVRLEVPPGPSGDVRPEDLAAARQLAFTILQGARVRIVRTEFISCPSCGRTQFDLEETTRRIKARTAHLKGLKIAIMGCVVNGPGEMAGADFGYVGWGPGRIALYVGQEMVARDVPAAEADERLVRLIQECGRWVDPPPAVG